MDAGARSHRQTIGSVTSMSMNPPRAGDSSRSPSRRFGLGRKGRQTMCKLYVKLYAYKIYIPDLASLEMTSLRVRKRRGEAAGQRLSEIDMASVLPSRVNLKPKADII